MAEFSPDRELLSMCRVLATRRDLLGPKERQTLSDMWQLRESAWSTQQRRPPEPYVETIRATCRQALGVSAEGGTAGGKGAVVTLQNRGKKSPKGAPPAASTPVDKKGGQEQGLGTSPSPGQLATKQIEPWPPPVPTISAYFRDLDKAGQSQFTTIGVLADQLEALLIRAGYTEIRYWNAPHGFAVVMAVVELRIEGGLDWHCFSHAERVGFNVAIAIRNRRGSICPFASAKLGSFPSDISNFGI
jgi:hypothetical protein